MLRFLVLLAMTLGLCLALPTSEVQARSDKAEVSKSGRIDPADARPGSRKTQKLLNQALEALQGKDYAAAETHLTKLASERKVNNYERAKIFQIRSQIANERGDFAEAAELMEQAVELDSLPNAEHFQAILITAQLYGNDQAFEQSIEWFDRWLLDAESVPGPYWAMQAQNYYYLDDFDRAIALIDQAFAAGGDPDPAWAQIKANSLYELERFSDAAAFAQEQKLRFRDRPELRSQFLSMEVSAHVETDDYPTALAVLEDARNQGWLSSEVQWKQLYQLYFEAERYSDSSKVIEDALGNGPLQATPTLLYDLGEAYYLQEALPKALDAFTRAASMSPDNGQADMQRGHILLDQELDGDAEAAIQTALRKGGLKQEGHAWYLLCLAEYNQNKNQAALQSCRKAVTFAESKSNAEQLLRSMGAR